MAHPGLRTHSLSAGTGPATQLSTMLQRTWLPEQVWACCSETDCTQVLHLKRDIRMSHQRGGGAELRTGLSLSHTTCGSSGNGSSSIQDIPQGRGQACAWGCLALEIGSGQSHVGTHLRNVAQSTHGCLGLTRKNEKQISVISVCVCVCVNICHFS